jgi:hypothetical protein
MDIDTDEPPAGVVRDGEERIANWRRAAAIRRELLSQLFAAKKSDESSEPRRPS